MSLNSNTTITAPNFDTNSNKRIDVFLAENSELTRSTVQKLLSEGQVSCNGKIIQKNHRIKDGDVITYHVPAPIPMEAIAEDIPLDIIYEDSDLLVVNKARGMVVHPAAGHYTGTLVNALLYHCQLSEMGDVLRPGIVHRLDRDTSGLMVVAKNNYAHVNLAEQLSNRTVGRVYNALCFGTVKSNRQINLPIGRHPTDRKKMAVITTPNQRARTAITNIEVVEHLETKKGKKYTLVIAKLETGRTHQIRVHMAHINHPILGDVVYGPERGQPFGLQGQILHARELHFTHPKTGEELVFTSPLPEYFQEIYGNIF